MNSYKNYIDALTNILKNFNDNNTEFDDIIKNILIKIFDIYYSERDIQQYNIDNVFKKYNMNMYNILKRKHLMTKCKKIMFIKHRYDKKEYIMKLLKKNNIVLNDGETYSSITNEILKNDGETYSSITNEILKNDIDCYTKYIHDF